MSLALAAAQRLRGATMPNPPVGAAGLDAAGNILSVKAHAGAGSPHAEALVVEAFKEAGILEELETVVVTLEPCNHQGRTPPCTELLLRSGVKRVVFGSIDPNPHVKGGGQAYLEENGIEVITGIQAAECRELIRGFSSRTLRKRPFVTVKRALRTSGSMIPANGRSTFTSQGGLRVAHELRAQADAIITGSGTVLADNPAFTVRYATDPRRTPRIIALLDRRNRVPAAWLRNAADRGFVVITPSSYEEALAELAALGVMEVLVEAGPTLSNAILAGDIWDESVTIWEGEPSRVEKKQNPASLHAPSASFFSAAEPPKHSLTEVWR